jgi:hypothetical protein
MYSLHKPEDSENRISGAVLLRRRCLGVVMPHDDALVVTLTVANHGIHRILVDNGSSADILYWPAFQQMGIDRDRIKPFGSPLVGFGGEVVYPIGIIPLLVTAGTTPRLSIVMVDFLVIDRPFRLQCDYRSARIEQVESCNLDLSPHDEIPNRRRSGRGERRSSCSTKVLQHVDEEGLESDHSHGGLSIRDQRGTSRTTGRGGSWRRESPINQDLPHTENSRRPRGFPLQEFGGVCLVT